MTPFQTTAPMWEIECYDWNALDAFRDTVSVPELLNLVLFTEDALQWEPALSYLESCGSDMGVPCAATPALVSCLVSIAVRVDGRKRSDVLSLLEEFTCGRGAELYSEAQRKWLREAVNELIFVFKDLVDLMERSSIEDAKYCVDMLAYCAEHQRTLAERVGKYLELCQARYPQLEGEVATVTEYFAGPADVIPPR